jgi:hypothetical protein
MERPQLLTAAQGRTREAAVFDEHEEWPEMLHGCERKPFALDRNGANANRFASIRTVRREP